MISNKKLTDVLGHVLTGMPLHSANCTGDCCNYDRLTDRFLDEDAEWAWPTKRRLNHLRSSAASTPAAEDPGTT